MSLISRKPSCEACRKAKLACDHKRPACTRCIQNHKATTCAYRASPFKRRRAEAITTSVGSQLDTYSPDLLPDLLPEAFPSRRNLYPNPGHLGSSSYVAIFNYIGPDQTSEENPSRGPGSATHSSSQPLDLNPVADKGAEALKQLLTTFDLGSMVDLVTFWLAKGVSLALAKPFVECCAGSMKHLRPPSPSQDTNWHLVQIRNLTRKSTRLLEFNHKSTLCSYIDQFSNLNIRCETLGIFVSAVIRATFDVPFFPRLYTLEEGKHHLRRLATRLADCCLEICLSLDCLNDLQLIFMYENFIVHSYVDGDQSFHSWRSLGDVIASAFALGYHENIGNKPGIPLFLVELRRAAFARIYSADKNVAIFLGRPPRMSKRFCFFQIPSNQASLEFDPHPPDSHRGNTDWRSDAEIDYMAETRWSALCASAKEEILELLFEENPTDHAQSASIISMGAEAQWQALPAHFRLEGSLKKCNRSPFERDFLVSTRLNYLHVQFLLRLVLLGCLAEPDTLIVEIAQQILALVVEAILFRDHLANSGTGLVWKIAHYGLPAAGIVLLAMLRQRKMPDTVQVSRVQVFRNLHVLVAEVQMGSIVSVGDPNYALLSKATQTIQIFLESVNTGAGQGSSGLVADHCDTSEPDDWSLRIGSDPWNLELEFWQNLADHPLLSSIYSSFQDS